MVAFRVEGSVENPVVVPALEEDLFAGLGVDGAHRICRMKAAGVSRGCFFVLDEATALSLVVPYPAHGAKAQRIKHIGRYEAIALGWKLAMDYYGIDGDCEKRANWTVAR